MHRRAERGRELHVHDIYMYVHMEFASEGSPNKAKSKNDGKKRRETKDLAEQADNTDGAEVLTRVSQLELSLENNLFVLMYSHCNTSLSLCWHC